MRPQRSRIRAVASTLAPIENCISAAFGTLHGVLHGGADQAALEVADNVGTPDRASTFVDECLTSKTKVMGMGHREYKVLDPGYDIQPGFEVPLQ